MLKSKLSSYDNIFHIDQVPNEKLYLYYAISDIFVLPSITTKTFKEPWGYVINEAMCQGCAIITSDAVGAGVGGLVKEGLNGYIVPENNSKALKEILERILNDEQLLRAMKKKSKDIIKDWTYPRMVEGFINALNIADENKAF
jgi:glycosyltransferase involved in cell wall biosynthesis